MRIAILGATSQIAKDVIRAFTVQSPHKLSLFARRPADVSTWLQRSGLTNQHRVAALEHFNNNDDEFDAILNFIGVGNPAQMALMGASIYDITYRYDQVALDYVQQHPQCRYLFLSSGAAYGASFNEPVHRDTTAVIPINHLQPQDWYGVAKLHAECRHRSLPDLPIIDIRVFNYFSPSQDRSARFLMCDILRAIDEKSVLKTSSDYIVRDYLHPDDFYRLVDALLTAPSANAAVDCYSLAPISKPDLLAAMQNQFGLLYEITENNTSINATGNKPHYYSLNTRAADFGYVPTMTSLAGITKVMQEILNRTTKVPNGSGPTIFF